MSLRHSTVAFLLTTVAFATAQGNFGGKIVAGPEESSNQWIYVQGTKGTVRRVDVSHARVFYSSEVAKKSRRADPADSLREGTIVRVVAAQDDEGEWKATEVRIISTPGQ